MYKYAISIREETLDLIKVLNGGVLPEFEKIGTQSWTEFHDHIVFTFTPSGTVESFEIMKSEHELREKYGLYNVQGCLDWAIKPIN